MNNSIRSNYFDYTFILAVGLWATLIGYFLNSFIDMSAYSGIYWLILVVAVDVAHVYSSLYRTYLSSEGRREYNKILVVVPIICFLAAFALALHDTATFWTVLVYIAVYHFIKQQVGFVRIYTKRRFTFDEIVIWTVTVGAILVWHIQYAKKSFYWFIKNDFFRFAQLNDLHAEVYAGVIHFLLQLTMLLYVVYNLICFFKSPFKFNKKPFVLTVSTFVAWYFGIAVNESDFIFTFTNVLTHGIPYLALVWHTQKEEKTPFAHLGVFMFILLIIAFVEEGFWDALIWREHQQFFDGFYMLTPVVSKFATAIALALLILPQLTHYILDGYIWKTKGKLRVWSSSLPLVNNSNP